MNTNHANRKIFSWNESRFFGKFRRILEKNQNGLNASSFVNES